MNLIASTCCRSSLALLALVSGCAGPTAHSVVDAKRFRSYLAEGDLQAARSMMADDPRLWFDTESGEGLPWTFGGGPWAGWDREFRKQTEIVGWTAGGQSATLTFRETNDYFLMLERGWVTNQAVYLFDDSGALRGLVIRAIGQRSPGRTEEFRTWAQAHEPEEFAYLHPDGEINPRGDRSRRYRALLERWRASR